LTLDVRDDSRLLATGRSNYNYYM